MEHLIDGLFARPFVLLLLPLAFAACFGFLVSLVLAVGLVWARRVLAERRQETEERRAERAERRAERERRRRRRSGDVSSRRYISGEYADLIQH